MHRGKRSRSGSSCLSRWWLGQAALEEIGSSDATCRSEMILNSAGTPSSAKSTPIRMLVRVSIAISGCRISNDCPLDNVSRIGSNGRRASISRKVWTVMDTMVSPVLLLENRNLAEGIMRWPAAVCTQRLTPTTPLPSTRWEPKTGCRRRRDAASVYPHVLSVHDIHQDQQSRNHHRRAIPSISYGAACADRDQKHDRQHCESAQVAMNVKQGSVPSA